MQMKSVQFQLTTKCNQRCIMCRKYTWKESHIDIEGMLADIDLLSKECTVTFSGGDPLEYNKLKELADYLEKNEIIYQVFTNLNYILDDEKMKFLKNAKCVQVSLDASLGDLYKEIRRPVNKDFSFDRILQNIKNIKEFTEVKLNCTVSSKNYYDLIGICRIAYDIGVKVRFFPVHTDESVMLKNEHFENIKREFNYVRKKLGNEWVKNFTNIDNFEFEKRKDYKGKCYVKKYHKVVDEKGRAYTCCRAINDNGFDYDGEFSIGQNEQVLKTIFDENVLYDYCSQCDRYRKFNENWDEYKNKEGLFL